MTEAEIHLAKYFSLSQEETTHLKPSGGETLFHNRIHWAKFYLKKAGLVDNPPRSSFKITQRGESVLRENPKKINVFQKCNNSLKFQAVKYWYDLILKKQMKVFFFVLLCFCFIFQKKIKKHVVFGKLNKIFSL